ncbi:MAG: hypothetical protein ACI9FU_000383 [Granulosicoccus sp.]
MNFGGENLLSLNLSGQRDITLSDVGLDGDIDIIASSNPDSKLVWFENQGGGSFSLEIEIATVFDAWDIMSLDMADLDGDGHEDILAASDLDEKIVWYNYQSPVTIRDVDGVSGFSVYPNPTDGILYIENIDGLILAEQISVFNPTGQRIVTSVAQAQNGLSIHLSDFATRVYTIRLLNDTENRTAWVVVK